MPAPPPYRRRRAVALAIVVVLVVGIVSLGVVTVRALVGGRSITVTVVSTTAAGADGPVRHRVALSGDHTVAHALRAAGVVARAGRLLAVKTHATLDPDHVPARITIGGLRATATAEVGDGQQITVANGQDEIEATEQVKVVLPAPPIPDVISHVHHRGRPGMAEEVKGVRSGEVVSLRVLTPTTPPRIATEKVVAFTFDDGPTPQWTPPILAMLASRHVHGTFCAIGQQVRTRAGLTQLALAAGNQLCNHTLDHVEHLDRAPHARVVQQIQGGADAQTAVGLPPPRYYRPPGGDLGPDVLATAKKVDEQTLFWKVDTEDWKHGATVASILANLRAEVEPGAIILMHDGGGDRSATVTALGQAIDWLRSQGYDITFPVID